MSHVAKCALFFGGVPERSKGSDCKSDGSAFGGSNPPPSTKLFSVLHGLAEGEDEQRVCARETGSQGGSGSTGRPVHRERCGCSSMVEPQPSKLIVWVRFPSPAPDKGQGPRAEDQGG